MTMLVTELEQLTEGLELEAKAAQGRDGRGEVPADFFKTYSAMANTDGGEVLLGLRELPDGSLNVLGIQDVERVIKTLWDTLNNQNKVSACLLGSGDVEDLDVEGKHVIRVRVPRASRKQRPVFLHGNPLTGTYRRSFEGDYRCQEEEVRRMLAEQVEDERDARILGAYGLADIDSATLAKYRQSFKAAKPDHLWNGADDKEFLRLIGGWQRDRASGTEGLTAAGLLMFGKLAEIREQFPYFMLDYQELPSTKEEPRWVDRVTLDGAWSGNLYDFYHLVISRLFRDLKVPFRIAEGGVRVDETSVHEALREAFINTLIHADYTGQVSIRVIKRPDGFEFRNPGTMRMPANAAVRGGVSDCRNRRLQAMFRFVGLGEQAGSGLPKVYASWRQQEWRRPELAEEIAPYEQTVFELRMASLLPADTVSSLEQRFGPAFFQLSEVQKLALVAVGIERSVTHARLGSMTDAHSRDVTLALYSLVQRGMLQSSGQGKRTFYYFPGERPAKQLAMGFVKGSARAGAVATRDADRGGFEAPPARIEGGSATDRGGVEAAPA
ncbi:MAG TPA: AAA family ATPase, partial [Myxococcales bacterium]|nr:AAA family ATPase [Myxococcales bacterium]